MEYPYDNDAYITNNIPTIVTNDPSSLMTTDVLRVATRPEPDRGIGIIGATTTTTTTTTGSTSSPISSDSNVDNTTASVTTESHTDTSSNVSASACPIRTSGQVCICDVCEVTRLQLLRGLQQQRPATDSEVSLSLMHRNVMTTMTSSSNNDSSAVRNKRAREEYKYDDDDDDDDDDDHHCDIPAHHKDTTGTSTVALTEVVTKARAVINSSSDTGTAKDPESEQQRLQIMSSACRTILQCIGEDPDREGLQKTPERWAKALLFLCHGYHLSPSQVTNNAVFYENHNEMVVVRNIDVHSLCEHHMVPFTGHVHIGYIPNGKIIGLSKLARLADLFARRLQVQERLTRQIADAILESITPLGVAVVMECTHYCMVMRGVQKTGAITTTSSVRGCFETNSKTRAEFFSILHGGKS